MLFRSCMGLYIVLSAKFSLQNSKAAHIMRKKDENFENIIQFILNVFIILEDKMASAKDTLVIVESPSKAKTIGKFLGKNYTVVVSVGHIRDLPKSKLGIDIENDFEPQYISIRGKGDLIKTLKKETKNAKKVYLATDPDREGEAIAWHLA